MKKKLAIIGANESIAILIERAKSLGYETHVFAWQCGDPGEKAADFFYPISLSEKDLILEKCREIGVCGVCSITSDFAAPVVAYVSRHLGLPGNPERTDIVARNKYEMRKAFKETGVIYCPRFFETNGGFNLEQIKDFSFPVIVKPTDRWSSKGITRVDSIENLQEAIKIAVSESFSKKAIVEEYVEGPEYSAECIVFNGEPTVLAFTKKKTTGYPHYIETGHTQPSDIPVSKQTKIIDTIKIAIKTLGIYNSAAHAEFRIMKNGEICFMEIGARMGGDFIGTDLTPISTGIDYVKMVIDVACGKQPCFEQVSKPSAVAVDFIMDENDIKKMALLKKDKLIRYKVYDKCFDKKIADSSSRHGFYIYKI